MENTKKVSKDVTIDDPILYPYFIIVYSEGGYGVCRHRETKGGEKAHTVEGYPSSFEGCLRYIAKKKVNEGGGNFDSVRSYLERWKDINGKIISTFSNLNLK